MDLRRFGLSRLASLYQNKKHIFTKGVIEAETEVASNLY
jgi:hypothetical protein